MNIRRISISQVAGKMLTLLLFMTAIIATFYLTNLYLITHFSYSGEAYMKGPGHLLDENFTDGLLFITSLNLAASFFISSLVFALPGPVAQKMLFKIFNIFALATLVITVAYIIYKLININDVIYQGQTNNALEISLTWLLRITGFYLAYAFIRRK